MEGEEAFANSFEFVSRCSSHPEFDGVLDVVSMDKQKTSQGSRRYGHRVLFALVTVSANNPPLLGAKKDGAEILAAAERALGQNRQPTHFLKQLEFKYARDRHCRMVIEEVIRRTQQIEYVIVGVVKTDHHID